MNRIRRAGRQLQWIVAALLVLTPVAYVAVFLWQGPAALLDLPRTIAVDLTEASSLDNAALFVLGAFTPAVYWLSFWFLHKLARHYAAGEVFSTSAARQLRLIGLLLLSTDFVHMMQTAVTGPVLTLMGLSQGFVSVQLRLGVSVIGLFIVLISRIMLVASDLQEQQRLTV
ncbi:MAG: DUF2975 domain-containing protein [Arenicellales bacterium]